MKKLLLCAAAWLLLATLISQPSIARAQNTIVTYQGRITDNGTNFNGTGQFKFAIVTSNYPGFGGGIQTATATATVSGGQVVSINMVNNGYGYTTVPAVTITGGGGSGATATANLGPGVVGGITVNNHGSGYTSAPTVTIDPPTPTFTSFWSHDSSSMGGSEPLSSVSASVANGLFTVGLGDTTLANMNALSASLFATTNLQLRIWFNDSVNGSKPLSPVQNLTAAPYAAFAYSTTTASNAAALNGLPATNFWQTGGNAHADPNNGAFLGTTDTLPLELRVHGVRGLRIEPTATVPNVIGGYAGNVVDSGAQGVTIGGGGTAGYANHISSILGTVAGGSGNVIGSGANDSTIGGGRQNQIGNGAWSGIIGGGTGNNINPNAQYSVIPGGYGNTVGGYYSLAAGEGAQALHNGTFVWCDSFGGANTFASTGPNQFLVHAAGGVGINTANPQGALTVNGSVIVDSVGLNTGTAANALLFGGANGEGIGSIRIGGQPDSYGLNFYANYAKRLTIANNGLVGIGTNNPSSALEVNGTVTADSGVAAKGTATVSVGSFALSAGVVSVTSGIGIYGYSSSTFPGVRGDSASGVGVYGETYNGNGNGVYRFTNLVNVGVEGVSSVPGSSGVAGISRDVSSYFASAGILGIGTGPANGLGSFAVYAAGIMGVEGDFWVNGNKNFMIDHPLDPANKYLVHSCIESPDVQNLYNGNVTTDGKGDAIVTLPNYFLALNKGDFHYQLTAIGQFAQAIISSEIFSNQLGIAFGIKTDKPNVKVSWQVMGIRNDVWNQAHPQVVEREKPAHEKGFYGHPELYGQPEEKGLAWARFPGMMRQEKIEREKAKAAQAAQQPASP